MMEYYKKQEVWHRIELPAVKIIETYISAAVKGMKDKLRLRLNYNSKDATWDICRYDKNWNNYKDIHEGKHKGVHITGKGGELPSPYDAWKMIISKEKEIIQNRKNCLQSAI